MLSLRRILVLAALVSLLGYLPGKLLAANDSSAWFGNADPEFVVKNSSVSDADYPATYGQRGNVDCDNFSFTKRNGDSVPFSPLHSESQISGCYINTNVGAVDPNGYINVNQGVYAAELVHADNTSYKPFVFPNTDIFISSVGSAAGGTGNYIWLDHLLSSLVYQKDNYGRIRAMLTPKNQQVISDKNGNKLPVMSDNFGISDNGQWAVVDSPGKALLRINLVTMEVLPFANSYEYGNGIGAALKYAISSDGRFVAIASKNYTTFKIFDLSSCGTPPNAITAPVSGCSQRDLNTYTKNKIAGFTSILQMRFLTNDLLQFYASYTSGGSLKGKYVIAAPGTDLTGMDYLAMGDSFSSGEGSFKYEIGTDEHDQNYLNLCHLSQVSYPYLIAKKIQANSFHSVACSGARTNNISGGSGIDKDVIRIDRDNQYSVVPPNNSFGEWIPGYKKQISFINANNPKIITLSVGGNDIGFTDKLTACLKPGTCYPSYEDRQEVFNEIDGKLNTIKKTFTKTKNSADKDARIYVVGYPQIANADGSCGLNVHLNHDELVLASSIITRLNMVIKTAATQAGVNYVDIEDALNGFRLCENNDGNMAMNGLTAGNDIHGIIGNESFHPTEFGQQLMADKILGLTSYLGTANPTPVYGASLSKITDSVPALATATKTGRSLYKLITINPAVSAVSNGSSISIPLNNLLGLTPNAIYQINLNGNQTSQVVTDASGNATAEITISDDLAYNPISIDITGTDVTGTQIDMNTVVVVSGATSASSCQIVPDSGIDFDQDGVDDACDAVIGPAPVIENPQPTTVEDPPIVDSSDNSTDPDVPTPTNDPNTTNSELGTIYSNNVPVEDNANPQVAGIPVPADTNVTPDNFPAVQVTEPPATTEQIVTATGQTRPPGTGSVLLSSVVYSSDEQPPTSPTNSNSTKNPANENVAQTDQSNLTDNNQVTLSGLVFATMFNNPLWTIVILTCILLLLILNLRQEYSSLTKKTAANISIFTN